MYSYCHNEGMSGRCNIECEKFMSGDCDIPDEIVVFEVFDLLDKEQRAEIFKAYPKLINLYTEKEKIMKESTLIKGLRLQRKDREEAAVQVFNMLDSLSNGDKAELFENEECSELFRKKISVPIEIVCLENEGERRIFINGEQVEAKLISTLSVVMSEALLEGLTYLKKAVKDKDTALGCENFSEAIKSL